MWQAIILPSLLDPNELIDVLPTSLPMGVGLCSIICLWLCLWFETHLSPETITCLIIHCQRFTHTALIVVCIEKHASCQQLARLHMAESRLNRLKRHQVTTVAPDSASARHTLPEYALYVYLCGRSVAIDKRACRARRHKLSCPLLSHSPSRPTHSLVYSKSCCWLCARFFVCLRLCVFVPLIGMLQPSIVSR